MADDRIQLDRTDEKLLKELSGDARLPVAELARRVGLSKTPIQARLNGVDDLGVIRGSRAMLDPVKLVLY